MCPGCRYLRSSQGRQQVHSESCRRGIEALLRGDPSGSARLAVAEERINRALADAVNRQATKDPGTRRVPKRASVVCHPESDLQKRIALPPHTPVSYVGSSGSSAQPSDTASTGTNDMTKEERVRPSHEAAPSSGNNDFGDDLEV